MAKNEETNGAQGWYQLVGETGYHMETQNWAATYHHIYI